MRILNNERNVCGNFHVALSRRRRNTLRDAVILFQKPHLQNTYDRTSRIILIKFHTELSARERYCFLILFSKRDIWNPEQNKSPFDRFGLHPCSSKDDGDDSASVECNSSDCFRSSRDGYPLYRRLYPLPRQ